MVQRLLGYGVKSMHFEILVEDRSGMIMLENVLLKIHERILPELTYRIKAYSGIGRLPKNLNQYADPKKRALLNKLPQLIQGYGRSLGEDSALVVVIDSDRNDCREFKQELNAVLDSCRFQPIMAFCLAIEEMEAWLLGDRQALLMAYPDAKLSVLANYTQDGICDTWELLADAISKDMARGLKKKGYPEIGIRKCEWAERISPFFDIENNSSPSFQHFIHKLYRISGKIA